VLKCIFSYKKCFNILGLFICLVPVNRGHLSFKNSRTNLSRIRDRDGDGDCGWFDGHVVRRVGDGSDTSFWYDRWLGDVPFCDRFRRLFDLTENKFMSVANLFSVDSEQWGDMWRWRRRLWQWEEEMLAECRTLLLDVLLFPNVSDRWVWLPAPSDGYTVRGAYNLLTSQVHSGEVSASDLVWHNQVPLKVSVFAWRLHRVLMCC
jgi:hypothetical protein